MEIWRKIDGFSQYEVSNMGNIRNIITGKNIKPQPTGYKRKYRKVNLNKTNLLIHRIVAKAFSEICGEWFEGCEIDHIDTDTTNNTAFNLKICDRKTNQNNPLTKQHLSDACKGRTPWGYGLKYTDTHRKNISKALKGKYGYDKNPNSKQIIQFDVEGKPLRYWNCLKNAIETLELSQPSLSSCLSKKSKTCGGYKWKYLTEYLADLLEQIQDEDMKNERVA